MTFAERHDLAADPTLVERVKIAAVKTAIAVSSEDGTAPNATDRDALAEMVVKAPQAWAEVMVYGVLTNANVGTGASDPTADSAEGDDALEFVLSSLWDAYA